MTNEAAAAMNRIMAALGGSGFLERRLAREIVSITVSHSTAEAICTWQDICEAVVSRRLEWPLLRVFRAGKPISPEIYTSVPIAKRNTLFAKLDYDKLQRELSSGGTLSVDSIEEMVPTIRSAAETLGRFVHEEVGVNAYASWGTESAFGPHWDNQDIIILQLDGQKHWTVFGPSRQHPMVEDWDPEDDCPHNIIWEGTIKAGDVIHVPRGWWHDAAATGTQSLHLTFSFTRRTMFDCAMHFVERLRADTRLQVDIDRFGDTFRAGQQQEFQQILSDALREVTLSAFLDYSDKARSAHSRLSLPWRIEWPESRTPERVILLVPSPQIRAGTTKLEFIGTGKELTFPEQLRKLVNGLIENPEISYGELQGISGLDEPTYRHALQLLLEQGIIAVQ